MTESPKPQLSQMRTLPTLADLRERLSRWDRRIVLSGFLAVILALLLLALIAVGPVEMRFGAAVGLLGLLIGLQLVVLFVRLPDRSTFGLARKAFADGQFEQAASQLEAMLSKPGRSGQIDPRILVLLGNSYRQLGHLADSHEQLNRALQIKGQQPTALYGLGRTVLAEGDFEAAADWFDQALAAGAPAVVGCELALAEWLAGNQAQAIPVLQKMTRRLQIESYRAWLVNGLLLLHAGELSSVAETLKANLAHNAEGRAYWQADAERHNATVYSQRLTDILKQIDQAALIKTGG